MTVSSRAETVEHLLGTLWDGETRAVTSRAEIDVVGHRVVHGGPKYEEPVLLTPDVRAEIAKVSAFAPLHNRAELEGVEVIEKLLGPVPQVAVFDTGFHRRMPQAAAVYPGPYQWFESGIHRYGFHGINHQYCAARAAQLLRRDVNSLKLVSCHLGNGCSLAAIREGHSIDTTMGFTPLEGLMMGTRSGSIDPGILTYLMREGRPGPFFMSEPARVRAILGDAGWKDVAIEPVEMPLHLGGAATLDEAVEYSLQIGPAARAMADAPETLKPALADALREALAPFASARGVFVDGAAFVVGARAS